MKKLLLALFSVIIFSSTCFGANKVHFGVKFKADKSAKDFTFGEKYSFDGCCYLEFFSSGEVVLRVRCYNAKHKEEAITTLKALSEAIEKAGYGECMLNKSEIRKDLVMHGKYVYSEGFKSGDFSNLVDVSLGFHSKKVYDIRLMNAYYYN